jgi:hypothetical protein
MFAERGLDYLVAQGYLQQDDGCYRFTHAEIRAAVAASVAERTRRRVCVTAARHLIERQAWPGLIAGLLERAGEAEEARSYRKEAE